VNECKPLVLGLVELRSAALSLLPGPGGGGGSGLLRDLERVAADLDPRRNAPAGRACQMLPAARGVDSAIEDVPTIRSSFIEFNGIL
jgi:hypothetical protein